MTSKTTKKTTKKPAKKPVAKKTAPKKAVAKKAAPKKSAVKKVAVKPATKKAVTKKPAAKKTAAKKTVAKKPVAKKPALKKVVAKKAPAKKPAVKKTAAKQVPKKAVAKSTPKAAPKKKVAPAKTPAAKKPLAPANKNAVKASPAAKITPIRAPKMVVAKISTSNTKSSMTLPILPPDYEPKDTEEFMSPVMKEYFRQRLVAWRDELLRESEETLHNLHEEGNMQKPDITDRASEETDLAIEFRTRDRERKLLNKINEAIGRIEDGSYGYCEETGDPIPVKRLIARPTAVRTLEAEELHERRERTQRDLYE